ncbi:MAG: serine/threonine protein kinase [Planctomycetota bacterium]|nr:MAG: serine/threonine protein kinase [Planctomycetota bacterium]
MRSRLRASPVQEYLRLLKRSGYTLTLRDFLRDRPGISDNDLGDLIEADGRARMAQGLRVSLDDYLDAVAQLQDFPVALDAAIDMALRSMSAGSTVSAEAVAKLSAAHPELESAIRNTALLNEVLLSTNTMRRALPVRTIMTLPTDFGPRLSSGERRYLLREFLGRGAFADVYLGVDRRFSDAHSQALVAVKILNAKKDEWAMRQAAMEATKARRVDHPHVVRVIDWDVCDDADSYIVYEHVSGGSLDDWFESRGRFVSSQDAARIVMEAARGVQAAHAAGLVHADLKPGNILMTADDTAKVADFGVAVETSESARAPVVSQSSAIGSMAFMSPEQYRLEPGWRTPPTDIYALGGLLYWLLTGRLPNGDSERQIEATLCNRDCPPPPPALRSLRRDVDADLEAICQRALAWRPHDRHSSAGALADDLEAWLSHEPIGWRKPSLPRVVRLWAQRRPYAAAFSLLAMIALAGTLFFGERLTRAVWEAQSLVKRHESRMALGRDAAKDFIASIQRRADKRHVESSLFDLYVVESYSLGRFANDAFSNPESNKAWIPLIEQVLASMEQSGRGRTLSAGLWRTGLAFRLTALSRLDEAAAQIKQARDILAPLLTDPQEPTLRLLDALDRCVLIGRLADVVRDRALTPAERQRLQDAEEALWRRVEGLDPAAPRSRQETLFAHYVAIADSPAMLDQPKRAQAANTFITEAWRDYDDARASDAPPRP